MKKILIVIIAMMGFVAPGAACGYCVYKPNDYFTFRACGSNMQGDYPMQQKEIRRRTENCMAWARITSMSIPMDHIDNVVYKWSREQLQEVYNSVRAGKKTCHNLFMRWIAEHDDSEIMDFLLMAKECEEWRGRQNSKWYYHAEGDEVDQALSRIAIIAQGYDGTRLEDRYRLQAMRALFAQRHYDECISYWQKVGKAMKNGVLKEMTAEYVGGAYIHTGRKDEVKRLYEKHGLTRLLLDSMHSSEERFDWMLRHNPNHPWLITEVQRLIHSHERWYESYDGMDKENDREIFGDVFRMVERVCQKKSCRDMSPWYYAYAYLMDRIGDDDKAMQYIRMAERTARNAELKDAIRVMKMLITAQMQKVYTEEFEHYLYAELVWLDKKVEGDLDLKTRQQISVSGIARQNFGLSQYYWSDMMRKLLVTRVAPMCLRSGHEVRALQYLNLAENNLFSHVGKVECNEWNKDTQSSLHKSLSWEEYRKDEEVHNHHDYVNQYFIHLDSMGVEHVIALAKTMENPQTSLDSFLLAHSYADPQYLNDIIGTQLMAQMRYKDAIGYLKKVSAGFNRSRNIFEYCNVDPFTLAKAAEPSNNYKLDFAHQMYALQQQISEVSDVNAKAQLMLRYAEGLRHSLYKCWPLTSYYYGLSFENYENNYRNSLYKDAYAESIRIREEALTLFTDREKAAKANYKLCRYKTAARRYPFTETARYIRRHCDVLRDYR